ncbi:MAG: peptidoglycan-binding protein [Chitinophagaceae bacterium]|nr:peptidoglycan-binding protein [Chitinophagaceae bacterium]
MNTGPNLHVGDIGTHVLRLQSILVHDKLLYYSNISGIYDAATKTVVKDLQLANGLPQTGNMNSPTWAVLPADTKTKTLLFGSRGLKVKKLQTGLNRYFGNQVVLTVDGVFGRQTEDAVFRYQKERNITIDGIVGYATWWVPAGGAGATLASLSGLV